MDHLDTELDRLFAVTPGASPMSLADAVRQQVRDVDPEAQRMSLSLKAAIAKPEKATDGAKEKAEVEEPPRELAVPKRSGPLKGGITRKGNAGEQFGLKW